MGFTFWIWLILTGSRFKGLSLEGRRLLHADQLTAALRVFREVCEKWPDRVEGYEGMEQVFRAMGLLDEARREGLIAEAMRDLRDKPGDAGLRLRLAKGLVAKQMYATALPHIDQALKLAPQDLEVLRLAGVILRHNRQLSRALEVITQALNKDPLDPDLYEQQSFTLRALDRPLEASQALGVSKALQTLAREPSNQEAMERAIFQLSAVKRRRQALALVERSLETYPQATGLHCLRADLLVEQGRHEEALVNLLEALALEPTRLRIHSLLAAVYQQLGRQDRGAWHRRAAELLEQARRSPDDVDSQVLVIDALLHLRQLALADDKAEELCRKYPHDWRSHVALGKVRKEQGRLLEALDSYRQATRLGEKVPAPFMAMAWLLAEAGQVKDALYQARQAVNLSSRDPEIRRQLADLLAHLGFSDLANEERHLAEAMAKANARRDDEFAAR